LDAISNSSNLIEELLGWLASSEGHLLAMEEDPLPPESSVIEEMLKQHQVSDSAAFQNDLYEVSDSTITVITQLSSLCIYYKAIAT